MAETFLLHTRCTN